MVQESEATTVELCVFQRNHEKLPVIDQFKQAVVLSYNIGQLSLLSNPAHAIVKLEIAWNIHRLFSTGVRFRALRLTPKAFKYILTYPLHILTV